MQRCLLAVGPTGEPSVFAAGSVDEVAAPKDVVWMLDYLFATVLDGRNVNTTDGVRRALGRPPKDFAEYARDAAAAGAWS